MAFDRLILGVGVRPHSKLARAAGLKTGSTGAISVDLRQRTSDPRIYAAGDNCEATFLPTGSPVNIPLAGPANKQGRVAGQNAALDLMGVGDEDPRRLHFKGVLGTSIVRAAGMVAGGTGLSEKAAKRIGMPVGVSYNHAPSHAGYYPGAQSMLIKLIYSTESGRPGGGPGWGG